MLMKTTLLRRHLGLLGASALVLSLVACASTPAPLPLTESLARQPELSTFNRLIEKAGLQDSLRAAGPLTVFAPNNEAFKAVPAKTLEALSQDPVQLKAVLSYHIVPAKLEAAEIQNGHLKTLNGANLSAARAGTFVTIEEAVVQTADLKASNGVAHVVDRVLLPPKK
ncbi:fasciclin domain-containing protein [Paucibacter sp. KBW04]|uniref:fasciclin domain-containing protein n=1 Tax=Paucibacter sp. KBW04 TaxID=2153361 RepID=UPI001E36EEAC|nr:fasciclin domain-containing protein [Paucibacter sp. KBW04]